eukprot:397095-Hanusia_phi.AAC.1
MGTAAPVTALAGRRPGYRRAPGGHCSDPVPYRDGPRLTQCSDALAAAKSQVELSVTPGYRGRAGARLSLEELGITEDSRPRSSAVTQRPGAPGPGRGPTRLPAWRSPGRRRAIGSVRYSNFSHRARLPDPLECPAARRGPAGSHRTVTDPRPPGVTV